MKKWIINIFIILIITIFFIPIINVSALNLKNAFTINDGDPLEDTASTAGYERTDIKPIIATIIQTALSFLGVIFLMLMIYGGYLWMTARGNEEQTTKAKNTITAAIIGIVIVLSAYAISYLVVKKLGDKALESTTSAAQTNFAISRKTNKI